MFKFNSQGIPDSRQCPIDGVKEVIATCIVLRSDPFGLHYPPQGFRKVQVRGIRRKVKEEKPTFLPQCSQFPYFLVPMYARIVKHDERVSFYAQGKVIEVLNDLVRVNAFSRGESMIAVVPVYHAEDVDSLCFLGRDIHIFVTELPAVRHIAFGAYMTFIAIIEIYFAVSAQMFKFLQLLALIRIELRRGYSPWAFSYSLISCANADKKRLNVRSLASLPVAFCQASLALLTLCLSCSMALRTTSSSVQSMIGLRPRPGRVCRPLMPSAKKRFTQKLTDTCDISVCRPMALLEKPADLSSTARQRIRKQWLEPLRKPASKDKRSESVNLIDLTLPIEVALRIIRQRYQIYMI